MVGRHPSLVGFTRPAGRQERLGPQVGFLGLLVHLEVVKGPAEIDVGPDVVRLNVDGLLEVPHGAGEVLLALERVADVVEKFCIVLRHFESGRENCHLVLPLEISDNCFGGENAAEKHETRREQDPPLPGMESVSKAKKPVRDEEAEAHGGKVEDPLGDDEADGEEKVGGREEGKDEEGEAEADHPAVGSRPGEESGARQEHDGKESDDGRQVSDVADGTDERHGV